MFNFDHIYTSFGGKFKRQDIQETVTKINLLFWIFANFVLCWQCCDLIFGYLQIFLLDIKADRKDEALLCWLRKPRNICIDLLQCIPNNFEQCESQKSVGASKNMCPASHHKTGRVASQLCRKELVGKMDPLGYKSPLTAIENLATSR